MMCTIIDQQEISHLPGADPNNPPDAGAGAGAPNKLPVAAGAGAPNNPPAVGAGAGVVVEPNSPPPVGAGADAAGVPPNKLPPVVAGAGAGVPNNPPPVVAEVVVDVTTKAGGKREDSMLLHTTEQCVLGEIYQRTRCFFIQKQQC